MGLRGIRRKPLRPARHLLIERFLFPDSQRRRSGLPRRPHARCRLSSPRRRGRVARGQPPDRLTRAGSRHRRALPGCSGAAIHHRLRPRARSAHRRRSGPSPCCPLAVTSLRGRERCCPPGLLCRQIAPSVHGDHCGRSGRQYRRRRRPVRRGPGRVWRAGLPADRQHSPRRWPRRPRWLPRRRSEAHHGWQAHRNIRGHAPRSSRRCSCLQRYTTWRRRRCSAGS
jgi:hypothetical protein